MFSICRYILLIAIGFVIIGCADNSDRMDLRVGLFFTEDAQRLIVMGSEGDLRVGKDLVSTLTDAVQSVFASVLALDSYPTKQLMVNRQLNLVVIVQVQPVSGHLTSRGSKWRNRSRANHTITAELVFYNSEMTEIASIKASGRGSASAEGIIFDTKKKVRVNSVKSAIRNLGDDVALQINSHLEIRKMAE